MEMYRFWKSGEGCATEKFPPAERRYLKEQLDTQGAAPVLVALAALGPPTAEATDAIADAQTYFPRNANASITAGRPAGAPYPCTAARRVRSRMGSVMAGTSTSVVSM